MTFCLLSLPPLQLLDIAGNLLERPLVARDASDKYLGLIGMFTKDLDAVRMIYCQRVQEEAQGGRLVARGFGWGGVSVTRKGATPLYLPPVFCRSGSSPDAQSSCLKF